jgi:hypothetical protein
MLENKAKKSYGSYSRAGKTSAENFYAIIHKDEILNRKKRNFKYILDKQKKKLDYLDDKIYLSKITNTKYTVKNIIISPKKTKIVTNQKKNSKLRYHSLHHNIKENNGIIIEPTCTKYFPKYDYVHKRLITGPLWKDLLGRECPILNMENATNFLCNTQRTQIEITDKSTNRNLSPTKEKHSKTGHNSSKKKKKKGKIYSIVDTGQVKCLVDMDITTQRGDIKDANNLRIRTDRPFIKNELHPKNPLILNLYKKFNQTPKSEKPEKTKIDKNSKNLELKKQKSTKSNNKTISSYKNKNIKNIKNTFGANNTDSNFYSPLLQRLSTISPEIYKVPEISNTMPYEQKERIKQFKKKLMPQVNLNYSSIRERPLSMVVYKKLNSTQNRPKFVGIDPSLNFDIDKVINKYNNHVFYEAPNFNSMTSRPYDKNDPLPNFMKQMFNRMSVNRVNDKSLKLNGYSEGKFLSITNSFFPKSSFNSIINMSLLKDRDLTNRFNEKETQKLMNRIGFKKANYRKYKHLILEGGLNRFDKITFKTISKKKYNGPLLKSLLLIGDDFLNN